MLMEKVNLVNNSGYIVKILCYTKNVLFSAVKTRQNAYLCDMNNLECHVVETS